MVEPVVAVVAPTTVQELFEAICRDWPLIEKSDRSTHHVWKGPTEGAIAIVHVIWTSNGRSHEGLSTPRAQRYFTEADAIRAFWNAYRTWVDEQYDILGRKPHMLVWRVKPEMTEKHGAYSVRARFATAWTSHDGIVGADPC